MFAEIAVDRRLQIDQRAEDAALQAPAGQRGKKAFDRIGPGARGRGEVKRPARMAAKPVSDLGMLVDGVIVEDCVNELAGRHRGLDPVEKPDEFLVAMARHALADDRAIEDIEGGKQRGRAMPDLIVDHCPGAAFLDRQTGLSAIERLDLRRLVD